MPRQQANTLQTYPAYSFNSIKKHVNKAKICQDGLCSLGVHLRLSKASLLFTPLSRSAAVCSAVCVAHVLKKKYVLRQKKKTCRVPLNVIICSHQAARRCVFLHSCTNGHLSGGAHTCFVPLYKFGVDFHVFPRDPSPADLHNTSSGFAPLEVKTLPLMLKFFLLCLGLFSPFKHLFASESAILQLDG